MTKKIKVGDKMSFRFVGSNLEGTLLEFYTKSNKKKALVRSTNDGKNYKYPVEVELLTKL